MRIALRPSGGRGDYELAGSDNGVNASDLLEKCFYYQITPSLTIDGKAKAHRLDGKPRIRPEIEGRHPYCSRLLASSTTRPKKRTYKDRQHAINNADPSTIRPVLD